MDEEEHMNEVLKNSVGISGSEAENKSDKNMEISDSLDEVKMVEKSSLLETSIVNTDLQLEVGLELTDTVSISEEEGVRGTVHDESLNGSIEIDRRGIISFCETLYIVKVVLLCVCFSTWNIVELCYVETPIYEFLYASFSSVCSSCFLL